MRESYSSFSFSRFLEDLREEIRFSKFTQEAIASNMGMCRETLCRKLNNGELSGRQLYQVLVTLEIL